MSLKISLKKKKKPDLDSNPQDASNDDELPKECSESDATEGKLDEAADKVIDEVEDEVKEEVEDGVKEKGKLKEKVKSKDKVKVKEKVKKAEGKSKGAGAFGSLFGKKVAAAAEEAVGDLDKAVATIEEDLSGIDEIIKDPTNVDSCIDGVSQVVDGSIDQKETESVTESEEEAKGTLPDTKKSKKMSRGMSLKRKKMPDLDSNPQDDGKEDELPSKDCLESETTEEKPDEAADEVTDEVEIKSKKKYSTTN
jgi:hypothetical protein